MRPFVLVTLLFSLSSASLSSVCAQSSEAWECLGSIDYASYQQVSQQFGNLGLLINNPVLPKLILGGLQVQMKQEWGEFRLNAPLRSLCYRKKNQKGTSFEFDSLVENSVLIFPLVPKGDQVWQQQQGATHRADGTLFRAARKEGGKNAMWAKVTADGQWMLFATSEVLLKKALADFEQVQTIPSVSGLARIRLTQAGLQMVRAVMNETQANQKQILSTQITTLPEGNEKKLFQLMTRVSAREAQAREKKLENLKELEITLDISAQGLSIACLTQVLAPHPPAAPLALPDRALDEVPAPAPYFLLAGRASFGLDALEQKQMRESLRDNLMVLSNLVLVHLKMSKDGQKYEACVHACEKALQQAVEKMPLPDAKDWHVCALACDAAAHPYLACAQHVEQFAASRTVTEQLKKDLLFALEQHMPHQKFVSETPSKSLVIDGGALMDEAASHAQILPQDKRLVRAKKTVATWLGDTKWEVKESVKGTCLTTTMGCPQLNIPSRVPTNEKILAELFPEAKTDRPHAVFMARLANFMRQVILPFVIVSNIQQKGASAQRIETALKGQSAGGFLACCAWERPDGSLKTRVRLTAPEVRALMALLTAIQNESSRMDEPAQAN